MRERSGWILIFDVTDFGKVALFWGYILYIDSKKDW